VLAVGGRYETGGFYSGTRAQTVLSLTLRMRPGYIVRQHGMERGHSGRGGFTSNMYRVVGETQFTPWLAVVDNIQYQYRQPRGGTSVLGAGDSCYLLLG
jgi:hypothetical protein